MLWEEEAGAGRVGGGETPRGGVCKQLGWAQGEQQDQTEGGSYRDLALDPPVVGGGRS